MTNKKSKNKLTWIVNISSSLATLCQQQRKFRLTKYKFSYFQQETLYLPSQQQLRKLKKELITLSKLLAKYYYTMFCLYIQTISIFILSIHIVGTFPLSLFSLFSFYMLPHEHYSIYTYYIYTQPHTLISIHHSHMSIRTHTISFNSTQI